MIPVRRMPEPDGFDQLVRQPGLRAIAELVGEATTARRGRKRTPAAKHRSELKHKDFPTFWQRATDDLLAAYKRLCAYASLYIEPITGAATVDHWAPKSKNWDKVYEWDNYRLACSIMNARKNDFSDVIDPFECADGLFALDLISLKAIPGPSSGDRKSEIETCIARLGLNGSDYSTALEGYYHAYLNREITHAYLSKRAPFLASEMRRQNKLLPEDVVRTPPESAG